MRRTHVPVLILLAACTPEAPPEAEGCVNGLDVDEDGVCDRASADWSLGATLPEEGHRTNIFGLPEDALDEVVQAGLGHTSVWPIDVSGVLLPYEPLAAFLSDGDGDPEKEAISNLARTALGFGTMDEMYAWLGLASFSDELPMPEGGVSPHAVGAGVIDTQWGRSMSFSCGTCHTAELFGKTVVGLTNRRARANEFFELAKGFFPTLDPALFERLAEPTASELEMFIRTQHNLTAIGSKPPEVRGLDTSLAQVATSLARREEDAYATRNAALEANPRPNALETFVADSKPAVWWTMKYKTRWLADGSIVSGNPVFTNFLWNELGRGTDLEELEVWMQENRKVADEITVAVFATQPPRWVDWFGASSLDEAAAKRGHVVFEQHCASCHGSYDKGWDAPDADARSPEERLATVALHYTPQTQVVDVGTDLQRAQGMDHFAGDLNRLAISEWMGAVVEPVRGYVPPPLDGIWARFPYLHNHSVPTLCDLLTVPAERTAVFWMGPSEDPSTDFDADCVGYPTADAVPDAWKEAPDARFDTTREGLSNAGHDEMLTDASGAEVLSADDKSDLIAFLKTL